jgi:hypothetical protein
MNIVYCNDTCPIGRAARDYFLKVNNSAFGAAFDFQSFTKNCFNACPFYDKHRDNIYSAKEASNASN